MSVQLVQGATGDDRATLPSPHWRSAEVLVCALALASLGLRIYLPSHVPLGLVPTLATAPVWVRAIPRYRYGRLLGVLTLVALVFGLGLSVYASTTHQFSRQDLASNLTLVLLTFCGVGVVLWGRQRLGTQQAAFFVAVGMVAGAAVRGPSGDLNFWKGGWATPTTILVLALTYKRGRSTIIALLALAGMSIAFDTRAQAVVLVLAAVVVAWQLRRPSPEQQVSTVQTAVVLSALGVLAYQIGTRALVSGYLGAEAQERSVAQINTAGSLILGGRPEVGATFALMRSRFQGYGFGILPENEDLLVAKDGLARLNYNPDNGYVERFMFGRGFELHSVVGDLWVRMGPLGLFLVLAIVAVLVSGIAQRMPQRSATGLLVFVTLWTFWNTPFSPLLNAGTTLTLAVGLALMPLDATPALRGSPPGAAAVADRR